MLDWLKVIPETLKGIIEMVKELQKMAGGYKRGQLVFWLFITLCVLVVLGIIALMFNPAYESVSAALSHFNIYISQVDVNIPSSLFPNIGLALLLSLLYLVFLVGFAAIVGTFLGILTNLIFAPKTTGRIDSLFAELLPLLRSRNASSTTESTSKLLTDVEDLYSRWNQSRVNKIARWLDRVGRIGKRAKKGSK